MRLLNRVAREKEDLGCLKWVEEGFSQASSGAHRSWSNMEITGFLGVPMSIRIHPLYPLSLGSKAPLAAAQAPSMGLGLGEFHLSGLFLEQLLDADCVGGCVDADPAVIGPDHPDRDAVLQGAELFQFLTLL